MTRPSRFQGQERGASAILVAASLILMMGMAAMAVDFGAGVNDRRQNQTASDTGAVAGALSLFEGTELVNQTLGRARSNLRSQYSDTEWQTLWQGCTDPDRPVDFVPVAEPASWGGGTLDCISRNSSYLRVTLPTQIYDTAFGNVVGLRELRTSATTVVTILPGAGTGILPFAVHGGVGTGEVCLDSGTGTSQPPCDGSESGSFGNIAPPLFGNPFLGTPQDCKNQTSSNNRVPESIAMGVDHLIWKYDPAHWTASGWNTSDSTSNSVVRANQHTYVDECTETTGATALPVDGVGNPINTVWVDTGNSTKADVTEGLVSDQVWYDGGKSLLWRVPPSEPSWPTDNVLSASETWVLDDKPLWQFVLSAAQQSIAAPGTCDPAGITNTADMLVCLDDYQAAVDGGGSPGVIFSDDLLLSPRFGVAPQLWHDNLGSGLSLRPVEAFRPVFINRILFKGSGSALVEWYPDGVHQDICQLKKTDCNPLSVDQVTAFVLPKGSVSSVVDDFYPGDPNDLTVSIFE